MLLAGAGRAAVGLRPRGRRIHQCPPRRSRQSRRARLSLDRARHPRLAGSLFPGTAAGGTGRATKRRSSSSSSPSELNPTNGDVEAALRERAAAAHESRRRHAAAKRELQALVERSRDTAAARTRAAGGAKLPDSMMFSTRAAGWCSRRSRSFADLNVVFDPAFREAPITRDLRNATLEDALTSITASTHTFYRVTAPRTITIVPDTPAKRREYEEEIVRTFYLSNADLKEVIDLLRIVVDVRQISPITATNAISLKDTPERIAAAARLIAAIDKARPGSGHRRRAARSRSDPAARYGLQFASPGVDRASHGSARRRTATVLTLADAAQPDAGSTSSSRASRRSTTGCSRPTRNTRTLANPQLRTSEGHCRRRRGSASACRCRSRPSRRSPPAASTSSRSPRSTTRTSA